jgi:hypothetical protein
MQRGDFSGLAHGKDLDTAIDVGEIDAGAIG